MALKDIYFKAEDGYYRFLDWVDAHGLPIYSLVDAFEDRGIPTFPIALVVLIALIAGIGFIAYGIIAPGTSSIMLSVSSDAGAIANADVIITLPNGIVQTGNTTDEGKFLAKLPIGQEVGIKITKSGYKDKAMRFTAKSGSESLPLVLELLRKTLSRTIQLLEKGTTELVKKEVAVEFSCSAASEYSETKTTSNGVIELSGIPENCGILYAAPKNGFTTEQDAIELGTSGATVDVYLSEEAGGKGAINVYVANELQQAIAGIEVNLKDEGGMQIAKKITGSSGSAVFSEIPAGKYYFATYDASGKYAEYDGRAEINELLPDAVLQKSIALFTKAVGKIMLLLKDASTNAPVSNATVKLIKDGTELAGRPSAIDGKVEFNVAENVLYDIVIDHPAYMLKTLTQVQKSAAFVDVLLAPATSANANSLKVKVVDEFALPVEDVKVRLHRASDDSIVGSELSTGINGEVAFERLEPGNYYAEVLKTGFGSAVSDVTAVIAREENSVVVRLAIGSGTFNVSVLDNEQKPLAAAKVEVYNAYTNARLSENTTNLQGTKAIDERIDRKIYFVASASGYLKHTTIAYLPIRDVTQNIEIALAKDIAKLEVKVLGIFATEDLEIADSLSPGQKYIAKLQLLIPANSSFDEAGMHIRAGSDDALIMEKDPIYLRNIYASTSGMTKGSSYTPPNNYATDALHLTTGNAKWSNIVWKNASDGIYDAEAEIIVKDGIAIGTLTELQYRGWGKKGAYVRFPTDSTLGSSESSGSKQALYAQTNSLPLSIGPSNLCDDVFCYRLIIEDIASGNLQTSIVDSYSAKVSNDYKLIFTITSKASTTFASSKLKIYNETGSLGFSGYEITTVTGAKIPGTLTGASLEIDVGDAATNSKFYGNLGFRTAKEGSTLLRMELISGNEKVMQKSISINIAGAKALSVEVLPKIIVPFVQNNLLIRVTDSNDGSALADAVVTILKNGTTLASGTTDFNGIFAYALASVSSGTSLEFRAEKSNYKQNSLSMGVSEDILEISPEKINETLTIAGSDRKDVELLLNNITELPLMISSISASGDLDGLATITFADTYEDSALPKGEDFNIGIILDLTDEGKRVDEITKLSASIDISLESTDASATWRISVPVNITIGFGAEADDSSCLTINPGTWDLFASTGSKTLSIALQNNCEVGGEGIVLRELSVKMTQANDNALGTFEISSDIEDSSDVSLTNTYAEIAPLIEAGASATIKLEFEPEDVTSGEATYNIIFKAINKTTRGDEEISTQLKVNAKVNDLQECVEVIQSAALAIESCPYNMGYGNYGNFGFGGGFGGSGGGPGFSGMGGFSGANYNPYQQWGYTPNQQPWLGNYDQLYANNYPSSNYQQPFYGSDYGTGGYGGIGGGIGAYGSSFNCGKTSFTVRNNCSSAVEISLSSDPALIVDKATTALSAGEELESEVQAAYMVGNYPIDVKARVKDSKDASTTITTLMVSVSNIFTKTWFDCVQLDKKKFKFNSFIGKPVSGKVFNDCYDSGVRLIYSADSIKISEGSMYTTPPISAEPGKTPAPEQLRLAKEVSVTAIYTEGAGDHTREILQFEIIKDVQYRGGGANLTSTNPIQQIGNLRYALTAGYYTVESRATMSVEFITRYGTRERIPFNVVLEDLWLAAGALPQEDIFGDPKVDLDLCINKDALNLQNIIAGDSDNCISVTDTGLFKEGTILVHPPEGEAPLFGGYLLGYSPADNKNWVMRISPKLCGTSDKIMLERTELLGSRGTRVNFETIQNSHDIRVTVDASALPDGATERFDEKLRITATRPSLGITRRYELPFKLCIKGKNVVSIPIKPAAALKCTSENTGSAAYDQYGFRHLKYSWTWASILKNACDKKEGSGENYTVCDATQFSIALNKKAGEIKKLAEKVNSLYPDNSYEFADKEMIGKPIGDLKDSENFFRFVKEKIYIESLNNKVNSITERYQFFVDSKQGILESPDSKSITNVKLLNAKSESINAGLGTTGVKALSAYGNPAELPAPKNMSDVVVEINIKGLTDSDRPILEELGAERNSVTGKWLMTYEDFYVFYGKIYDAIKNADKIDGTIYANDCGKETNVNYKFCVISQLDPNSDLDSAIWDQAKKDYAGRKFLWITVQKPIDWAAWQKDSATHTFISKEWLVNIYSPLKGALKFVAGIRHKPILTKPQIEAILKNGMENDDFVTFLSGAGYAGYYPPPDAAADGKYFHTENVEFKSYLMRDGYSPDFKADFKEFATKKGFLSSLVGDFTTWNLLNGSGGELVVDKPALYDVKIKYVFADPNVPAITADAPLITVSVDTSKPESSKFGEKMQNNLFFYMPIDGEVGLEKEKDKEGKDTDKDILNRDGYGTTWATAEPTVLAACNEDCEKKGKTAPESTSSSLLGVVESIRALPSGTTKGAEHFKLVQNKSYSSMRNGVVLSIDRDNDKFTYSPSVAVKINLAIFKNDLSRGAGIFYELSSGTAIAALVETPKEGLEGVISIPEREPIFNWVVAAAGMDFGGNPLAKGAAINEIYSSQGALCAGTSMSHALLWSKATMQGEIDLKTVAYLPAKYAYSLQIFCGADITDIGGTLIDWAKEAGTKEIALNTGLGTEELAKFNPLAIPEKISSGELCINTTANSADIFWNPDKGTGSAVEAAGHTDHTS
ncbi:MAG: hypothetical protein HYW05_04840 [Candidatus Diapherotrites archaeon]|nr:hypothetical protein [Candidatus Diapherotrites archaeon]